MKTKYFICSDIHGFYTEFKKALRNKKFTISNPNHKLIIIGDIFDRGKEAKKLLDYLLKLKKLNKLIIIKGNHESCMEKCLEDLKNHNTIAFYHFHNGTVNTIEQLTNINQYDLLLGYYDYKKDIKSKLKNYFQLVKDAPYYYEINNYILTHGYIPHIRCYDNLKYCGRDEWEKSMWLNGMEESHNGWKLKNKTIIVGHFHTSFGHYNYHHIGSGEFESDSCFDIFKDDSIIALDTCTALTKKVNILTLLI